MTIALMMPKRLNLVRSWPQASELAEKHLSVTQAELIEREGDLMGGVDVCSGRILPPIVPAPP